MGHGGALLIHTLWACVVATLIVVGEYIQCCPLLTDCRVEKTAIEGRAEALFVAADRTEQHERAAIHGSVCCQVPYLSAVLTVNQPCVMLLGQKLLLLMH